MRQAETYDRGRYSPVVTGIANGAGSVPVYRWSPSPHAALIWSIWAAGRQRASPDTAEPSWLKKLEVLYELEN